MSENIKIYKKTEEGYPKNLLQLPDAPSRYMCWENYRILCGRRLPLSEQETVVLMEKIWHMNMPEF